jgi:hypothetical protein
MIATAPTTTPAIAPGGKLDLWLVDAAAAASLDDAAAAEPLPDAVG